MKRPNPFAKIKTAQKEKEIDLSPYDMIAKIAAHAPEYDVSKLRTSIEIYISHDRKLCIMGVLDNNYRVWCSITTLDDREVNAAIFAHIADYDFTQSRVISKYDLGLHLDLDDWYRGTITRAEESRWDTPLDSDLALRRNITVNGSQT